MLLILFLQLFCKFATLQNKKVKEVLQDVILCMNGLEEARKKAGPRKTRRRLGIGSWQ